MALSSLPFRVLLIRNARLCRIYPKKCPMYFSLTQRYRWICSVKVNLCIKFSTFLTGKFYTTMAGFLFPLLIHKSACGRASSIFRVDATHTSSFPEFATKEIGEDIACMTMRHRRRRRGINWQAAEQKRLNYSIRHACFSHVHSWLRKLWHNFQKKLSE